MTGRQRALADKLPVPPVALADPFYIDDTPERILQLMDGDEREGALRDDEPNRKGIQTTGILPSRGDQWIAVFATGPREGEEKAEEVYKDRTRDGLAGS